MNVTKKLEQKLANAGFTNECEYNSDRFGPAEFKSYFEYLVDRVLAGELDIEPEPEVLWVLMKRQVNFFERSLSKAADDYRKLENKLREKESLIGDLIKE
jgi:hypothetical protein